MNNKKRNNVGTGSRELKPGEIGFSSTRGVGRIAISESIEEPEGTEDETSNTIGHHERDVGPAVLGRPDREVHGERFNKDGHQHPKGHRNGDEG